jgi:hypothetical protein
MKKQLGFVAPALLLGLGLLAGSGAADAQETSAQDTSVQNEEASAEGWRLDWGLEAKAHLRHSDGNRFRNPFPFAPEQLPVGQQNSFLETVNEGDHVEVSTFTLTFGAALGQAIVARAKVDFIDLYDRNPTSGDKTVDVDEVWIRFGRETAPARLADGFGAYLKVGKFGHFERQNDRHLESYGLISTAFNRFEDTGLELGVDLGRHVYLKGSLTQGNPLFMRDPNALAGDNGTDVFLRPNPDPKLKSGIVILYDAEVEDLDVDGDLEVGAGLGLRFENADGSRGADFLLWHYSRDLAETVELEGTFYGGDLDLLRGPGNLFGLPVTTNQKEEDGANLWLYLGGFSLFGQWVDQEVAGLHRDGFEVEAAWRFSLPLRWSVAGRQVLPFIAPAVRYSKLVPDFAGGSPLFPAPSLRWEWEKWDYGVRLGLVQGLDLTVEYADNAFILGSGATASNDELLTTLRWKL